MAEVPQIVDEVAGEAVPGPAGRLAWARQAIKRELWRDDPAEPVVLRGSRVLAQLITLTVRGFESDRLLLRASALTYITALSIIPMLGLVFAILRMVGGDETLIDFAIDQLTTVAPAVRETVRGYVANLDLAGFGTFGGALFFGTVVLALRHLETTLNAIWGVTHSRSWPRRFSDYLAVMVVAPISTGVAVSLATTLQHKTALGRLLEDRGFARLYDLGLSQVPVLFLFGGFTFLYWFFPNTRVRLAPAALGGVVAAVLFSGAREVYVEFQVGAATYQAVFGALSAVPLILAWLYACWAIVLFGAELAFATQNLRNARREMRAGQMTAAEGETVVLEIAVSIAQRFLSGVEPPTAERLAAELDEPVRDIRRLIEMLEAASLVRCVVTTAESDSAYVPARPLAEISVGDIVRAVRGEVGPDGVSLGARDPKINAVLERLDDAWSRIANETSISALVSEEIKGSAELEA